MQIVHKTKIIKTNKKEIITHKQNNSKVKYHQTKQYVTKKNSKIPLSSFNVGHLLLGIGTVLITRFYTLKNKKYKNWHWFS